MKKHFIKALSRSISIRFSLIQHFQHLISIFLFLKLNTSEELFKTTTFGVKDFILKTNFGSVCK